MSNNYAGKIIYSKDITDLMCRVNALVTPLLESLLSVYHPSGTNLITNVSTNGIYHLVAINHSDSVSFKIFNMLGHEIYSYSATNAAINDLVYPDDTSFMSPISLSLDFSNPAILWILFNDYQKYYVFQLNLLSNALTRITRIDLITGDNVLSNPYQTTRILGDGNSFFLCYQYDYNSGTDRKRLSRFDGPLWTETVLHTGTTNTDVMLSGFLGNNIVASIISISEKLSEFDRDGVFVREILDFSAVSPYLSGYYILGDNKIISNYTQISNPETLKIYNTEGGLISSYSYLSDLFDASYCQPGGVTPLTICAVSSANLDRVGFIPIGGIFTWYLYNATPARKESIGTTPADDALCTTASDGVYTLPKAGYCTNLIEDLRTAIEDLVSWGVWKNPSTGNAYNWTGADADNAYHCAMAACYADYGLTAAGYDWTRTIAALEGQPVVDLEVGEIDAILTLLEAADI